MRSIVVSLPESIISRKTKNSQTNDKNKAILTNTSANGNDKTFKSNANR